MLPAGRAEVADCVLSGVSASGEDGIVPFLAAFAREVRADDKRPVFVASSLDRLVRTRWQYDALCVATSGATGGHVHTGRLVGEVDLDVM